MWNPLPSFTNFTFRLPRRRWCWGVAWRLGVRPSLQYLQHRHIKHININKINLFLNIFSFPILLLGSACLCSFCNQVWSFHLSEVSHALQMQLECETSRRSVSKLLMEQHEIYRQDHGSCHKSKLSTTSFRKRLMCFGEWLMGRNLTKKNTPSPWEKWSTMYRNNIYIYIHVHLEYIW